MTNQSASDRTAPPLGRRRLLAGVGAAIAAALAGCSSDSDSGPGSDSGSGTGAEGDSGGENSTDGTDTPDDATPGATDTPERLETDVTGLLYSEEGSEYSFRVTVARDRITEAGYPARAVVETAGGETLAEESFESGGAAERTVELSAAVPDGTTRVVARGIDSRNGRGGTAMVADLEAGEIEAVDQGPEPQSFA